MHKTHSFLAFDTSTDRLSIALTDGAQVWQTSGVGGAQASLQLIPGILALLDEAKLNLDDLDAIVFGRGPGSFTGLRTACAVAQGLAFGARAGAGLPVLPVDTLLAVAEEARLLHDPAAPALHVTALLDARMDEMYVQNWVYTAESSGPANLSGHWQAQGQCVLMRPEAWAISAGTDVLAGNVFEVYAGRLYAGDAVPQVRALPTATALLRLAPALMAAGQAVDAAHALPRYVRDKVAFTTDERAAAKVAALAAAAAAGSAESA